MQADPVTKLPGFVTPSRACLAQPTEGRVHQAAFVGDRLSQPSDQPQSLLLGHPNELRRSALIHRGAARWIPPLRVLLPPLPAPPPGKDTASAAPPAHLGFRCIIPHVTDETRQRNRCRRTARPGVSQYADSWTPSTTQNRRSTYLATAPAEDNRRTTRRRPPSRRIRSAAATSPGWPRHEPGRN